MKNLFNPLLSSSLQKLPDAISDIAGLQTALDGKVAKAGDTMTGDLYNSSAVVVAAGTTQGTATVLTKQYNFVTTGSGGVKLPTPTGGGLVYVIDNDLATSLSVYPHTSGIIDGLAANAAKIIGAYSVLVLVSENGTEWFSFAGSAAFTPTGTTLPTASTPVGQFYIHAPTGRKVLMQWDGASWIPIINLGAATMYVDGASGSDSQNKGYGTGANAFATIQFAVNQIAGLVGGNVVINVAAGTYSEAPVIQGKVFTGAYTIKVNGALTLEMTVSSAAVAIGAMRGTVTKTGQFTSYNYSKYLAYFVTDNVYRVIYSNTNDVLTVIGTNPSNTTQDVKIYSLATIITSNVASGTAFLGTVTVQSGQQGVILQNLDIRNTAAEWAVFVATFSFATLQNCKLFGRLQSNQSNVFFYYCVTNASGFLFAVVGTQSIIETYYSLFYGNDTNYGILMQHGSKLYHRAGSSVEHFNYGINIWDNAGSVFDNSMGLFVNNCATAGLWAKVGGVIRGTTGTQFASNTTDKLADAASFGYID